MRKTASAQREGWGDFSALSLPCFLPPENRNERLIIFHRPCSLLSTSFFFVIVPFSSGFLNQSNSSPRCWARTEPVSKGRKKRPQHPTKLIALRQAGLLACAPRSVPTGALLESWLPREVAFCRNKMGVLEGKKEGQRRGVRERRERGRYKIMRYLGASSLSFCRTSENSSLCPHFLQVEGPCSSLPAGKGRASSLLLLILETLR